jgi:hypothetical protein
VSSVFDTPRYKVSGVQAVLDHEPGQIFRADIPLIQEQRLIASGALERLADEPLDLTVALDQPPVPDQHSSEGSE